MCKCTPSIRTPWCGKPGCGDPASGRQPSFLDVIIQRGVTSPYDIERLLGLLREQHGGLCEFPSEVVNAAIDDMKERDKRAFETAMAKQQLDEQINLLAFKQLADMEARKPLACFGVGFKVLPFAERGAECPYVGPATVGDLDASQSPARTEAEEHPRDASAPVNAAPHPNEVAEPFPDDWDPVDRWKWQKGGWEKIGRLRADGHVARVEDQDGDSATWSVICTSTRSVFASGQFYAYADGLDGVAVYDEDYLDRAMHAAERTMCALGALRVG